ncbi:lipopolysaccharide biosynthesis protein [Paenibacillus xylaniclasticus]|uniref:lipopolysaccharide biosynthesis protein n=1 Tax=Paenibacillus xylaniclasticus TaxID=588083 RepID=UPI001777FBAF|nr:MULTISPECIES: oligosaccharide flippase family protein [Paenibacillus]GFN32770.1 flippase [Paenibacillus curdlanolyticus]
MGNIRISKYLNSKLFKNLTIVFSESILTKALNFFIILLLTQQLGPSDYGKYSFVFVAIAFCSAFFDFGMENTAVRFSAKNKEHTYAIFGLYFISKVIIISIVTLLLIFLGNQIFLKLGQGEISAYIPYLIVGFLGESLLFVNDTYLQAIQRFKLRAWINVSRYVVSILFLLMLWLNDVLLLKYVLLIYYLPILYSLLFSLRYIGFIREFVRNKPTKSLIREMIHYEKWMLTISVPNNLLDRIDFFMISLWVTYEQIGVYNAAYQLSAIVAFIPVVFAKVMLPKMSELTAQNVVSFTKKIMRPTLIISGAMLCLIPVLPLIVPLLLGDKYIQAESILQVMLIKAVLSFALVPIEQATYSLGKPMFITLGKYVQIGTIVVLIVALVPQFGVIWAAVSVAAARFIYGTILYLLYSNYGKGFAPSKT